MPRRFLLGLAALGGAAAALSAGLDRAPASVQAADDAKPPAVGQPSAAAKPSEGQKPPAVEFPNTPVGEAARALADVVNSPDPTGPRTFAKERFGPDLMPTGGKDWTAGRYANLLAKLREQSGGLELFALRPGDANYLGVMFRARKAERVLGIEFFGDPDHPGKLRGLELHPMSPPGPQGDPWPQGKLDDSAFAAAIDRRVRSQQAEGRFSGVVLVAIGDRVVLHNAYGEARDGEPNTTETRIPTASVGKMITAVAVAQLVEQGLLSFDTKLIDVLPDYPNPDAAREVTIHHLLTHTAGVADPFMIGLEPGKAYLTPGDFLPLIAPRPLAFEPGTRHDYSNGNYAVLGAVVEAVSKRPFAEYVREHVYAPAGMRAADLAAYARLPIAIGYGNPPETDPLAIEPKVPVGDPNAEPPQGAMSGFGGLALTADDLYRFLKAVRESRLLGRAMTETVVTGKVEVAPGAPARYAYGFYDMPVAGTAMRGHSGGGGRCGVGSHAEMLWDRNAYVLVLGNVDIEDVRPLTIDIAHFVAAQTQPETVSRR